MEKPTDAETLKKMDMTQYRDKKLFDIHNFLEKHEWMSMDRESVAAADFPAGMKAGLNVWLDANTGKKLYVCRGCLTAAYWTGYGDYSGYDKPGQSVGVVRCFRMS